MNNSKTTTSIKCPYCDDTTANMAGFSMHLRGKHPDKWKGNTGDSVPANWDGPEFKGEYYIRKMKGLIKPRTKPMAVVRKGQKKPPIHSPCPFCDYITNHPPGLAHHIKAHHRDQWKGNLKSTMESVRGTYLPATRQGRKPLTGLSPERMKHLADRRDYERKRRAMLKAKGLTAAGKPFKSAYKRRPVAEDLYLSEEEQITPIREIWVKVSDENLSRILFILGGDTMVRVTKKESQKENKQPTKWHIA